MDKKDDNSIRKPSTFAHPTTTRTTDKFFTDYERYVKNRYTDSDPVRANHLPTYLTGKAFQCYDIQPTHVKDDYQLIKDKIQAYFSELEEELELEILKKFDPKIQTIDEYLEYAHHYFTARDIEDKRAILDLKAALTGPLQRAIFINKPKTWAEVKRAIKNADNQTADNSTTSIQSIVTKTLLEATPAIASKIGKNTEKLASLQAQLEAQLEALQQTETHTVAAMGGTKPTYRKPAITPAATPKPPPGHYPSIPEGHMINPRYRGPPEDYDPAFGSKMKKLREQGLLPPRSNNRQQQQQPQYQQQQPQYQQQQPQYQQQQPQYQQQQPQYQQQQPQYQQQQPQYYQQQQPQYQQQQQQNNTPQDPYNHPMLQAMMKQFMDRTATSSTGNQALVPVQQAPAAPTRPQLQWPHPFQQQQQQPQQRQQYQGN